MKHIWNCIREKIKKSQLGAATIEAIISFTGFLFVIFTILNIVNFCRAQMLISNAMDTVTKELSQYSYFYQVSGLQKFDQEIQAIGEEGAVSLNNVASSMGDLYNALGTAVSSSEEEMRGLANSLQEGTLTSASVSAALQNVETNGTNVLASMERLEAQFEDVADNPVLYLKSIVAVAGSEGLETAKSHVIAAPLAKSLLVKHFGDTRAQASAELERLGVVDGLDGMKFGMSTIFTREHPDEIHLVVYYKLRVVQFFQWADFEATICKETRARAWLGGDDVQALATVAVSDDGSSGESSGDGTITEEDDEEETQEEEESDSSAEDIRAQMIEQHGAEVVEAVSQGQDTSTWGIDDWNDAINLYQVSIASAETPQPTASPEPAPRPLRDIMIENFGQATVDAVSDGADISSWTAEEWQYYITIYLQDGSTWRDVEAPLPTPAIQEDEKKCDLNSLYDVNGNYTGGRSVEELDDLARDPAHAGSTRQIDIDKGIHEREVGLGVEESGKIDGPIIRDPSGNAEFLDANGQAWDVKSFNSNYKPKQGGYTLQKSMDEIYDSLSKNENVILDTTNLSDVHRAELLEEIEEKGLSDKIIVWP